MFGASYSLLMERTTAFKWGGWAAWVGKYRISQCGNSALISVIRLRLATTAETTPSRGPLVAGDSDSSQGLESYSAMAQSWPTRRRGAAEECHRRAGPPPGSSAPPRLGGPADSERLGATRTPPMTRSRRPRPGSEDPHFRPNPASACSAPD